MATGKKDETPGLLKSCIRSQVALGAKAEENIFKKGALMPAQALSIETIIVQALWCTLSYE